MFIQKPTFLQAHSQTYSHYKHNNTLKFLVSIQASGSITYVSKCVVLEFVEDVHLVGRDFTCEKLFAAKGASVLIPSIIKRKKQLSGEHVTLLRKLSRVRINFERSTQRLKSFRVFKTVPSINSVKKKGDRKLATIDKVLIVLP